MIQYDYKYICDHCGREIQGDPLILYPDAVHAEDPNTIMEEPPVVCQGYRDQQIDHIYCAPCVGKILTFANTTKKRGRKKKGED